MSILEDIIKHKKQEVEEKKRQKTMSQFARAHQKTERFKQAVLKNQISLIAEIKLASPSAGILATQDEVIPQVIAYRDGGADALSVVIDKKFFYGDLSLIQIIKKEVTLPMLAKDFIIDPYQLYEIGESGAEAVLLIAKITDRETLIKLIDTAVSRGMEPVVEVNSEAELEDALSTRATCIAVNARNLTDFSIDIARASRLINKIPKDRIALAFSGVKTRDDVKKYESAGANAVLVGTSLMKSNDVKTLIRELKGL